MATAGVQVLERKVSQYIGLTRSLAANILASERVPYLHYFRYVPTEAEVLEALAC